MKSQSTWKFVFFIFGIFTAIMLLADWADAQPGSVTLPHDHSSTAKGGELLGNYETVTMGMGLGCDDFIAPTVNIYASKIGDIVILRTYSGVFCSATDELTDVWASSAVLPDKYRPTGDVCVYGVYGLEAGSAVDVNVGIAANGALFTTKHTTSRTGCVFDGGGWPEPSGDPVSMTLFPFTLIYSTESP